MANRKYLIKERYERSSWRHFYNLYLCQCGNLLKKRVNKSASCNSCKDLPVKFDSMSALKKVFSNYQISAWERELSFGLSLQDFAQLVLSPCFYCSEPSSNICRRKFGALKYNGIDRQNNEIGYQLNNCVPCCRQCNVSKNILPIDNWFSWIERVNRKNNETTTKQYL